MKVLSLTKLSQLREAAEHLVQARKYSLIGALEGWVLAKAEHDVLRLLQEDIDIRHEYAMVYGDWVPSL